jgi:uncharacterized iron-regulated protein
MVKTFTTLALSSISLLAFSQNKEAYKIFDKAGNESDYGQMLKSATGKQVVFFGEHHNNAICHWLQLSLMEDLAAAGPLVLGAEMFESDNQLLLNEYLRGAISEASFEKEARLWPNYKTDYKPMVLLAKEKGIPVIATNIPRRYASMVHKQGLESLDSLDKAAKKFIAPLPIKTDTLLASYASMKTMMGAHGTTSMIHAQMIKDATMAHFILENMDKKGTFLHLNGAFHSDMYEGIVWYILQEKPKTGILTISTVEQDDLSKLDEEFMGKADYILVVPSKMTKTH